MSLLNGKAACPQQQGDWQGHEDGYCSCCIGLISGQWAPLGPESSLLHTQQRQNHQGIHSGVPGPRGPKRESASSISSTEKPAPNYSQAACRRSRILLPLPKWGCRVRRGQDWRGSISGQRLTRLRPSVAAAGIEGWCPDCVQPHRHAWRCARSTGHLLDLSLDFTPKTLWHHPLILITDDSTFL